MKRFKLARGIHSKNVEENDDKNKNYGFNRYKKKRITHNVIITLLCELRPDKSKLKKLLKLFH